jgi:hypothetical protein
MTMEARMERMTTATARKYEVVEKDEDAQRRILSGLAECPEQGIAYMVMMAGEPMSVADIAQVLKLSDQWYIGRFDRGLVELEGNGLIREAEGGSCVDPCPELALQTPGSWPDPQHFCSTSTW